MSHPLPAPESARDRVLEKRGVPGAYEVCAGAIIALAASLRLTLISLGWPHLNSDEGTMGLMALHIADHAEHPAFFYGQSYMGTLEAYLGALFFRLLGASELSLRLGLVLLFTLFLVAMYLLVSRLYGKNLALVSLGLLSLGSERMLFQQLQAIGGYVETLLFGAVVLLLSSWLALSSDSFRRRRRLLAYACWGVAAGLGLWSDLLILPVVAMAALLLVSFCRREVLSAAGLLLLLGLAIGLSPAILYDVGAPRADNAFSVLLSTYRAGSSGQIGGASMLEGVAGTLTVSLPIMTGGNIACPVGPQDAWPAGTHWVTSNPHAVRCALVHGIWGVGALALWGLAVILAVRELWALRPRTTGGRLSPDERKAAARQGARLALLASAAMTLILYALSPAAARSPWFSARYLTPLWLALPAVLAPLVMAPGAGRSLREVRAPRQAPLPRRLVSRRIWAYGLVAALGTSLFLGTVDAFRTTPDVQWVNRRQYSLVADLERVNALRIYSDYWSCGRITFQSRERVICSALDGHLGAGLDRYPPYRSIVKRAHAAAFAFPLASPQAATFAREVAPSDRNYRLFSFDGYVVYVPSGQPARRIGSHPVFASTQKGQETSGKGR